MLSEFSAKLTCQEKTQPSNRKKLLVCVSGGLRAASGVCPILPQASGSLSLSSLCSLEPSDLSGKCQCWMSLKLSVYPSFDSEHQAWPSLHHTFLPHVPKLCSHISKILSNTFFFLISFSLHVLSKPGSFRTPSPCACCSL